jgi:deoxyuridine 5'-triphosphate nucleotidohydrolase
VPWEGSEHNIPFLSHLLTRNQQGNFKDLEIYRRAADAAGVTQLRNMAPYVIMARLLSPDARLPIKGTRAAAGFDIFAAKQVVVPGAAIANGRVNIGRALVSTGLALAIPSGCVVRIGSRSGLSTERNIEVGAGWIDPDYRGEIKVELKNFAGEEFLVKKGDRIAQLFILQTFDVTFEPAMRLTRSGRGKRGFGSTGR